MRRLLALALALAFIVLPLAAQAWGPDGHQTVGAIAAGLLRGTPTEARVAALLGDMDLQLATLWADCAKGVSPGQDYAYPAPGKYADCGPLETPERIAEMTDYVRRNDRQCQLGPDEDACHRQTHYADIALQRRRYEAGLAGTRPDDVVGALRQAIRVLQGRPAPGQPQLSGPREALLVLVHLVGDIHQPLHVAAPYLDAHGHPVDPDRQGLDPATFTIGGNSLWLAPPASPAAGSSGPPSPAKLHTLWDAVPTALKPAQVDAAWLAEARRVTPTPGDPADWPASWATQSLAQARLAYAGLRYADKDGTHWAVTLPAAYTARADAMKRQQLTLAGARLAQLLKAVLAGPADRPRRVDMPR